MGHRRGGAFGPRNPSPKHRQSDHIFHLCKSKRPLMPRPQTPKAHSMLTDQARINPARHAAKAEPAAGPVGSPPDHLTIPEKEAWFSFIQEIPWLKSSDRIVLEMASRLRSVLSSGPMEAGDLIKMAAALRPLLIAMGATPAARNQIHDAPQETKDGPLAKFLKAN